jgi:MoxR-like ATPase
MMEAGPHLVAALGDDVVGRRREIEIVVAALVAGRHVLLEGPPGTGKSTLLRSIARHGGVGFEFVEGNAELTPARLIGSHDPSRVLVDGYSADAFVPGPLVSALEAGALLYLEEINRIPEETLNVLVTVMSEHELHVPRLGRVVAADGFRLVAAMNPFDAVGTARISAAVYDRTCRVAMGYQSAEDEREIVARAVAHDPDAGDDAFRARVVELVRATRDHPDVRVGASVRGAVDLQLLAARLGPLRGGRPAADRSVALDAALAALSGRIRLYEGASRTPESVIEELFARIFAPAADAGAADPPDAADPSDGRGKVPAPAGDPRGAGA